MTHDSSKASAQILKAEDWLSSTSPWHGYFEGQQLNTGITVLNFTQAHIGDGASLHVHEYDEIFIIRRGHALFTVGGERIEAGPGDVVFGPAHIPHKFKNIGPGALETTDIHLSDRWVQVDVEDPDLA